VTEALLAIGGEAPPRDVLADRLPGFRMICAADSGLDLLASWEVAPGLIVGDMDSLSDLSLLDHYPGAEILRFPTAKDDSDTELGLRLLRERGADRVVIAGGGGGRLDHLLAIRALFGRPCHPDEWHTAHESCYRLGEGDTLELASHSGATISVFPVGDGATGMESEGLRWPLAGLVWDACGFGLSNEASGDRVRVRAGQGSLLVVTLR
jgi:thiamine pyrophosphokinase